MTLLFDYKNKSPVNVPDDQVSSAVASGGFGFRKAVQIPVVGPDGEVGTIDAQEAPEAFRNGFVFQTKQMQQELMKTRIEAVRAEAYDKPLLAGAAGLLRGLSLGASDIILGAAGAGEAAREIKERSPIASGVGEVAGNIATGIVAAPLTTGMAAATTAKLGGKALAKVAGTSAAMAAEGAAQGLGGTVSDLALGDPQLTFERAVMNVGLGAVLGGGLGGLGKGTTEAISSLNTALRASTLPTATADVIGKAYAKLTGITKALPKDEADEVLNIFTKDRSAVLDMVENPAKFEQLAIDSVTKVNNIANSAEELSMQARETFRDQLQKVADFRVNSEAKKLSKQIGNAIRTMDEKPSMYANVSETARQINDDFVTAVNKAKNKGQVHVAVEDARKKIDDYLLDFGVDIPKGKARATQNLFKGVRAEFKDHLTDSKLYGQFGTTYGEINNAFSRFKALKKVFDTELTRKSVDMTGKPFREVDQGKVLTWFKNPENLARMRKEMALDELGDSVKTLASKTELDPAMSTAIDAATKSIDNIKKTRAMAMLVNRLESMTGRSTLAGQFGAGIGAIAGGIPGAGVGMILGAASANPKTVLKILSRVEELGIKGNKKMTSSLQTLLGAPLAGVVTKAGKAGAYASRRVTLPMALNLFRGTSEGEASPAPENDTQIELRKELDNLDGGKLDDRLTRLNPYLDEVSPNYYAQMHKTVMNTANFIRSKMPQVDNADMFGNVADMSRAEKAKLETYVDAAFRPMRALEELASENPDPRVFETIGALYPSLYNELQQRTLEIATQNPKISYKKKLALGLAFGIPTVPSLSHAELLLPDPAGQASHDEMRQAQPAQKPRALSSSRTEKMLSGFRTDSQNAFG